jgi:MFS family permease
MEDSSLSGRSGRFRVLVISLLIVTVSGMALAIVSAMGPAIVARLGLSTAQFGLATSGFFVATMLVAYPAGRWVDVAGWAQGLRAAGLIAAVGLGVGAATRNQITLAVAMSLTGAALGFAMPACVRAMKSVAEDGRLATPLGYLHAVIPASIMVVGAAVALLPIIESWRVAFGGAAGVAVLVTALVPSSRARGPVGPDLDALTVSADSDGTDASAAALPPLGGVGLLLVAVTLSAFASGVLVTSFTVSTVALGLSAARAASLLSFGTLLGVALRILSGVVSDRIGSVGSAPAGFLLACGAGGALLVASGRGSLTAGAVVALGFGLSWPGLLYAAVARRAGDRTGSAIGLVEVCASAGAAAGPTLFGLLLDGSGAEAAWYLMTAVLAAAALASFVAAAAGGPQSVRRDRRPRLASR